MGKCTHSSWASAKPTHSINPFLIESKWSKCSTTKISLTTHVPIHISENCEICLLQQQQHHYRVHCHCHHHYHIRIQFFGFSKRWILQFRVSKFASIDGPCAVEIGKQIKSFIVSIFAQVMLLEVITWGGLISRHARNGGGQSLIFTLE